MTVSKRLVLHFPPRLTDRPIVKHLVKDYGLDFNILKASISPGEEGMLIMELSGKREDYDKGVAFLLKSGVKIQSLSQDIVRNEQRCTHCGACVAICPSKAFTVNPKTREVAFDHDKCVACELCIRACPPHAMEAHL
ncbi:MAG TPA: (Fe-S)-binding protein [Dehalococcoidia bacterium]|nr:(Fe-S)-binding protein [Dehalococcoidia bacterium]